MSVLGGGASKMNKNKRKPLVAQKTMKRFPSAVSCFPVRLRLFLFPDMMLLHQGRVYDALLMPD